MPAAQAAGRAHPQHPGSAGASACCGPGPDQRGVPGLLPEPHGHPQDLQRHERRPGVRLAFPWAGRWSWRQALGTRAIGLGFAQSGMLAQVRAAKLTDMPCTAMALLPHAAGGSSGQPIVLCGSYDNKVVPLSQSGTLHPAASQMRGCIYKPLQLSLISVQCTLST